VILGFPLLAPEKPQGPLDSNLNSKGLALSLLPVTCGFIYPNKYYNKDKSFQALIYTRNPENKISHVKQCIED
jgi:hypothetical protein